MSKMKTILIALTALAAVGRGLAQTAPNASDPTIVRPGLSPAPVNNIGDN